MGSHWICGRWTDRSWRTDRVCSGLMQIVSASKNPIDFLVSWWPATRMCKEELFYCHFWLDLWNMSRCPNEEIPNRMITFNSLSKRRSWSNFQIFSDRTASYSKTNVPRFLFPSVILVATETEYETCCTKLPCPDCDFLLMRHNIFDVHETRAPKGTWCKKPIRVWPKGS